MTKRTSIAKRIGPLVYNTPLSEEKIAELKDRLARDQQTAARLRDALKTKLR
ncbi:MAG: hypothetical protein NVS3B1_27960 [Marmoricola sp.]